jgi:hypothetical protein
MLTSMLELIEPGIDTGVGVGLFMAIVLVVVVVDGIDEWYNVRERWWRRG